jgi:hypothetical protein
MALGCLKFLVSTLTARWLYRVDEGIEFFEKLMRPPAINSCLVEADKTAVIHVIPISTVGNAVFFPIKK